MTPNPAPRYSVLILTRNEADNLLVLIPEVKEVLQGQGISFEIVIVDGNSPDNTREVAASLGCRVFQQQGMGYGAAFREGLSYCQGEWIIALDADNSHPPQFLRSMIRATDSADIVVASRYAPGGSARMELYRKWLSQILSYLFARGLHVPVLDISSGYRMYRAHPIRQLNLVGRDFDILIETLIKIHGLGFQIREVPFIYEPRVFGRSNARVFKFAASYLRTLGRMWRLRNSAETADYDDRAYDSLIPLQRYWQRKRVHTVLDLCSRHVPSLNLGCGSSRVSRSLPRVIALDSNISPLRFLQGNGVLVGAADVQRLPIASQSVDQVIATQLIEYLPEPSENSWPFMDEVKRVLKPGGALILSYCDAASPLWRGIDFFYRTLLPHAYGSRKKSAWTGSKIKKHLEVAGFKVHKSESILGCEFVVKASLTPV